MSTFSLILSSIPAHLGRPQCTENIFNDVVKWLEEGSFVRLYSSKFEKVGTVFHVCKKKLENKYESTKSDLPKFRVIWLDFGEHIKILDPDQWPQFLKNKGYICNCKIVENIFRGEVVSIYIYRRNFSKPFEWAHLFNNY